MVFSNTKYLTAPTRAPHCNSPSPRKFDQMQISDVVVKVFSSKYLKFIRFDIDHYFTYITMHITAEKRGLNYYTSKDNFYSIKIKLETLVIRAKIRLKAQF